MEKNLKGKVSLVTGSSKGLGRAIVIELAQLGSNVVINYNKNEKSAQEVCDICKGYDVKALLCKADVSKFHEVEELIAKINNEFGSLDILVNNTGIIRDRTLKNMSLEEWNDVINTNLNGVFNITKLALPLINKNGRIINISSLVGITGNFGQTNYAASKSALFGFTKSLAMEVGKKGITVNVVAPGFIESEMTKDMPFIKKKIVLSLTALGRMGEYEEVAHVVTFLASDKATFITGEIINVNGGLY